MVGWHRPTTTQATFRAIHVLARATTQHRRGQAVVLPRPTGLMNSHAWHGLMVSGALKIRLGYFLRMILHDMIPWGFLGTLQHLRGNARTAGSPAGAASLAACPAAASPTTTLPGSTRAAKTAAISASRIATTRSSAATRQVAVTRHLRLLKTTKIMSTSSRSTPRKARARTKVRAKPKDHQLNLAKDVIADGMMQLAISEHAAAALVPDHKRPL